MLSNVLEHLCVDVAVRARIGDDDITAITSYDRLKLAPARDWREGMPRAKNDPEVRQQRAREVRNDFHARNLAGATDRKARIPVVKCEFSVQTATLRLWRSFAHGRANLHS